MIGLDTNVLVRYLVQDDPKQARAATALLEQQCTSDEPGWISTNVICEFFWVLRRAYGYPPESILSVLRQLLVTGELALEDPHLVAGAVRDSEKANVDFVDCLIGLRNRERECTTTFTFDRRAAQLSYFTSA